MFRRDSPGWRRKKIQGASGYTNLEKNILVAASSIKRKHTIKKRPNRDLYNKYGFKY